MVWTWLPTDKTYITHLLIDVARHIRSWWIQHVAICPSIYTLEHPVDSGLEPLDFEGHLLIFEQVELIRHLPDPHNSYLGPS